MKKTLIVLAIATIAAVGLEAVETSVTFFPLTQSQQFKNRTTWTITFTAPVVLAEASGTGGSAACHTLRVGLAQRVAANPDGYSPIFAAHLVTTTNVTTAGALTGSLAAGTLDTPATDAALFSAVSSLWSVVAGCVSNP